MELKPGAVPEDIGAGPPFTLTTFPAPHRWATRGDFGRQDWSDMLEQVAHPELWPGAGTIESASYRLPAWTFARYRDDTRVVTRDEKLSARETRARMLEVHGLIIDYIDEPAADGHMIEHWWGRHSFVAHTTGFHEQEMGERPPGPRWRVMLPFSHPVDVEVAARVAAWAHHPRHDVGIVAPVSAEVWRAVPRPALGPGGYRWLAKSARVLDPDEAVKELRDWEELDVRVRAGQVLEGTSLTEAAEMLRRRRSQPALRPTFPTPPIPGLKETLGDLWPGRMVALMGTGGSGRTTLAMQFVRHAVRAENPVLLVLTRMGNDEAVARLVALEAGMPARDVLDGQGEIDPALDALVAGERGVHLWTPSSTERTLERLHAIVRATSEAHGGGPVLVVVDGVEGWAVENPEKGARTLVSGLRDASHAGTLSHSWPGAAVVFVAGLEGVALTPERLVERAEMGTLHLGPLEQDAAAVVVTAVDRDRACIVVAKNRDGHRGVHQVGFAPDRGFTGGAGSQP